MTDPEEPQVTQAQVLKAVRAWFSATGIQDGMSVLLEARVRMRCAIESISTSQVTAQQITTALSGWFAAPYILKHMTLHEETNAHMRYALEMLNAPDHEPRNEHIGFSVSKPDTMMHRNTALGAKALLSATEDQPCPAPDATQTTHGKTISGQDATHADGQHPASTTPDSSSTHKNDPHQHVPAMLDFWATALDCLIKAGVFGEHVRHHCIYCRATKIMVELDELKKLMTRSDTHTKAQQP